MKANTHSFIYSHTYECTRICLLCTCCSSFGAHSPSAMGKRLKVDPELLSYPGCTKTALANILAHLDAKGLLKPATRSSVEGQPNVEGQSNVEGKLRAEVQSSSSSRQIRKDLMTAAGRHANTHTPYGNVVQQMHLGLHDTPVLDYVNPFAYLYHLTAVSDSFATMMADSMSGTRPMKLIMYIDELTPGNPLRPDKGRTTQSVYWCFADWPQWVLQRADAWLLFTTVRSSVVSQLPGGVSNLMRKILNIFFPASGDSFTRGVTFVRRQPIGHSNIMLTAEFCGFLADEKAHKEILGVKGAAGTKPCTTCKNVVQFVETSADPYLTGISCADYAALDYHTNDSFYAMVDRLSAAKTELKTKNAFARLEQVLGVTYIAEGLLFDAHLRKVLRPVDNCIRDWMHTMVSGGIAGTEMALVIQKLQGEGVTLDMLTEFAGHFNLPRACGKVNKLWFTEQRLGDDQVRSFASEQLNMLPILHSFLVQVVQPMGIISDNIRCFSLLMEIIRVLSLGPEGAMPHVRRLRHLIIDHHTLYKDLYPDVVKPKWHHLLHIPENMSYVGRLLSCFVTERKHRSVKSVALHIFRHYEHTVVRDLVNRQSQSIQDERLFLRRYLLHPREVNIETPTGKSSFRMSRSAFLQCGEVHKDDLIVLSQGQPRPVGKVLTFWESDCATIVVEMLAYRNGGDVNTWHITGATTMFADAANIAAPLVWCWRNADTIHALVPH